MSLQEKYKSLYKTKKQLKLKLQEEGLTDQQVEELTSNGICANNGADDGWS